MAEASPPHPARADAAAEQPIARIVLSVRRLMSRSVPHVLACDLVDPAHGGGAHNCAHLWVYHQSGLGRSFLWAARRTNPCTQNLTCVQDRLRAAARTNSREVGSVSPRPDGDGLWRVDDPDPCRRFSRDRSRRRRPCRRRFQSSPSSPAPLARSACRCPQTTRPGRCRSCPDGRAE